MRATPIIQFFKIKTSPLIHISSFGLRVRMRGRKSSMQVMVWRRDDVSRSDARRTPFFMSVERAKRSVRRRRLKTVRASRRLPHIESGCVVLSRLKRQTDSGSFCFSAFNWDIVMYYVKTGQGTVNCFFQFECCAGLQRWLVYRPLYCKLNFVDTVLESRRLVYN